MKPWVTVQSERTHVNWSLIWSHLTIFESKSAKEYSKEWKSPLSNNSVRKHHRQLIFTWSCITIFERKSAKEYWKENPRKNIRLSRIFFQMLFRGFFFVYSFADFLSYILGGFFFKYSFTDFLSNILSWIFFQIFFCRFSFDYSFVDFHLNNFSRIFFLIWLCVHKKISWRWFFLTELLPRVSLKAIKALIFLQIFFRGFSFEYSCADFLLNIPARIFFFIFFREGYSYA